MQNDVEAIVRGLSKAQRWVPGYEGHYYVDAGGDVYSAERTFPRKNRGRCQIVRVPWRRLVKCLNRNGYPIVRLFKDNKARTFEVHRLVCRCFHGEPDGRQEAAHSDGNKENCSAKNVRWASSRNNHADKKRHGTHLHGDNHPHRKLTSSKAVDIFLRANKGENMGKLAREFSVDQRLIRKIKAGESWAAETLSVQSALRAGEGRDA